jgi:hypothetical protein
MHRGNGAPVSANWCNGTLPCTIGWKDGANVQGRPLEFYTDKASMFEVTPKLRDKWGGEQLPLAQITRALVELGVRRTSAHSPQAKGRIERCFSTAQDRLVKGLRLRQATTLEELNEYLENEFLPEESAFP